MLKIIGNDEKWYVTDKFVKDEKDYWMYAYEANMSEEHRSKFVSDAAAISRGKFKSNNSKTRFKSLLKEAHGKTPSRPVEFCPVVLHVYFLKNKAHIHTLDQKVISVLDMDRFSNELAGHSYIEGDILYTNLRALLNAGIPYDKIPYATQEEVNEYYGPFKAVRVSAPMFVFNHLVTHTMLSKEARSERYVEMDNSDYWLPSDFEERLESLAKDKYPHLFSNEDWDIYSIKKFLLDVASQKEVMGFFKSLGYKREVYQRAMLEFRYKTFIMVGWSNDPKRWEHLINQREAGKTKSHTQLETRKTVEAIAKVIGINYEI